MGWKQKWPIQIIGHPFQFRIGRSRNGRTAGPVIVPGRIPDILAYRICSNESVIIQLDACRHIQAPLQDKKGIHAGKTIAQGVLKVDLYACLIGNVVKNQLSFISRYVRCNHFLWPPSLTEQSGFGAAYHIYHVNAILRKVIGKDYVFSGFTDQARLFQAILSQRLLTKDG